MSEKIKVLFLSANPASTGLLRLDEEAREIRESIARSEYRDSFELILQGVVGPTDLQETLLRYQPQIVHFSGFGSKEQGIILEDSFGHSKLLSKVALAELFKILKDSIRIVVLNACYSQPQAEELTEIIDYTIGISNVIEDKSAILFSASFYQALAYGRSVKEAFELAQINLELLDKSGSGKPVLLMRSGVADVPLVIPKETTVRGEYLKKLKPGSLTWLHLSDVHFRESHSDQYDSDIVIESLLDDIDTRIKKDELNPDFIAFTGDLAFSGKPSEYDLAREFFNELLRITGLARERLFIVPGNHDIDRNISKQGAIAISKMLTDRQFTNAFLSSEDDRRFLFERFKGYQAFFNEYFRGHLTFDYDHYFYVHSFDLEDRRIAVLGLNSAWLSMSDEDETLKLVIGERQTRAALKAAKETSTTLNIALLHHPLDWIRPFDRSDSGERLRNNCDFILHGHLHEPGMVHLSDPDGSVTIIPGGACYDTREYPNSYNFVRLNFESSSGRIYFREYVDRQGGYWAKGVRLYKNVEDGIYEFSL